MLLRVSKTNLEGVPNYPIIRGGGGARQAFQFQHLCKLEIYIYLLFVD